MTTGILHRFVPFHVQQEHDQQMREMEAKAIKERTRAQRDDRAAAAALAGKLYKSVAVCQSDAAVHTRMTRAGEVNGHEIAKEQAKVRAAMAAGAKPETPATLSKRSGVRETILQVRQYRQTAFQR